MSDEVTSTVPTPSLDLKQEPEFSDSSLIEIVDILKIRIHKQGRTDFGNLVELSDSIKAVGLLQSLCVEPTPDGLYNLIAGERRYRALMMLGWKRVPVMLKVNYNRYQLKLAQLLENLQRKDLEWPEEIAQYEAIFELKKKEFGIGGTGTTEGWNIKKQAALLNESHSGVQNKLSLAKAIRERPDLLEKVKHLNRVVAGKKIEDILHNEKLAKNIKSGALVTSSKILLGSCLDLIKDVPDNSIDCLITDPPFGLDTIDDNLGDDKGTSTSYTAFLEQSDNMTLSSVVTLLRELMPEIARVLKPSAHFYIFHCAQLYSTLAEEVNLAMLHYDHAPLIWNKTRTTTKFQGLSYPACYEPILFGCKPPRSKHLTDPKIKSILDFPSVPHTKKIHTFQKPAELIEHLIKNSTRVGDTILDPFAGSGVTIRVAQEMNRNALGFEVNKTNWSSAQMFLSLGAEALLGGMK